jgi:predicted nucleotidyltransferase
MVMQKKKQPAVRKQSVDLAEFKSRRKYSQLKLRACMRQIKKLRSLKDLANTCVYVTGSYARLEASKYSDIDLFFLRGEAESSNIKDTVFFSDVINLGEELKFPSFSNDGEYLRFMPIEEMLRELGGPHDDYYNHFTARMLLLLESQPLFNEDLYEDALNKIVQAYFRDFPDHSRDFRPIFLINDILRFWKTLCLNYEHKRNRPDADLERKRKQQVKNFKLKFSRMLTCFGTVTALCSLTSPVDPEAVRTLLREPPLDRLLKVLDEHGLKKERQEVMELYTWFLKKTALSTDELVKLFNNKRSKSEMFAKGDKFGDLVFRILREVTKDTEYMRYLVI